MIEVKWNESCSVMSKSWNSLGQNTGVCSHPFSRGSSQPGDQIQVSHIAGRFFNSWAIGKPKNTGEGSLSLLQWIFSSVQFSCSVVSDSAIPWMPGLPVHHQLLESTQTHVHRAGDAIQPSHPLLSPSPPALNLSQHQGLFKWVSSSHQVAKVLEFQFQHQSFQWTPRTDLL